MSITAGTAAGAETPAAQNLTAGGARGPPPGAGHRAKRYFYLSKVPIAERENSGWDVVMTGPSRWLWCPRPRVCPLSAHQGCLEISPSSLPPPTSLVQPRPHRDLTSRREPRMLKNL